MDRYREPVRPDVCGVYVAGRSHRPEQHGWSTISNTWRVQQAPKPAARFPPSASLRVCAAGSLSRELHTLFEARRGLGASRRLQLFKLSRFPLSPLHSQLRQTQKEKTNIFQGKWRYWTAWLCPPEPGGDWRALIFPLKGSYSGRGLSFSAEIIMINIIMKRKKN